MKHCIVCGAEVGEPLYYWMCLNCGAHGMTNLMLTELHKHIKDNYEGTITNRLKSETPEG